MRNKATVLIIPYKNFKHRIKLTKRFERDYYIENLDGYLYMVRRQGYEQIRERASNRRMAGGL